MKLDLAPTDNPARMQITGLPSGVTGCAHLAAVGGWVRIVGVTLTEPAGLSGSTLRLLSIPELNAAGGMPRRA